MMGVFWSGTGGTPLALRPGMDWPRRAVEQIPHRQFRPHHCPWPDCEQHHLSCGFRYKRWGFYTRKNDSRRVRRFRCKSCLRTFSQQTFACSYYAKRPRIGPVVAACLNAGSAHRQIARTLGCAPSTITRLSAKLGRHALLLQARALERIDGIGEPVVADHLESFVHSQLDALGIATAVGHESWFVYVVDPAPHRRGGKTTPAQRRQAARRQRPSPPPGEVKRSFRRMLDVLLERLAPGAKLTLITDDHASYGPAVAQHPARNRIVHHIYPNPKRGPKGSPRSPEAVARDKAMFPVDLLHSLLRHTCAHHRRETIAFGRRINAAMERAYLTTIWRNFVKGRSERKADRTTPAMKLGLADRPWSWARVLARRLFPTRVRVPEPWKRVYARDWDEDAAGRFVRHRLKHAA
jgi:transposase-like protein